VVNLSVALYNISNAIAPLFWSVRPAPDEPKTSESKLIHPPSSRAPLSESRGRKPVYLASLSICLAASLALIFTPELGSVWLAVWRLLQGLGSCAVFSVGIGTISDIYRMEQRGRAIGVYSMGSLVGLMIGPPGGCWAARGSIRLTLDWLGRIVLAQPEGPSRNRSDTATSSFSAPRSPSSSSSGSSSSSPKPWNRTPSAAPLAHGRSWRS